jgi:hypothetical protein
MITMLLGGLWHGAAWTFVLWGGFHGAGLVAEHALGGRISLPRWLRWFVFFHLIVFSWILFRSQSVALAGEFLGQLTVPGSPTLWTLPVVLAIAAVIGLQLLPTDAVERVQVWIERRRPLALATALSAVIIVTGATVSGQGVAPFIYFRF